MKIGADVCADVVAFDIKVPEFVTTMLVYLDVTVVIDTLTFEFRLSGGVRVALVLVKLGADVCTDVVAFEAKEVPEGTTVILVRSKLGVDAWIEVVIFELNLPKRLSVIIV